MGGELATKKHYQGKMCETIAMNWLVRQGLTPQQSVNPLDEQADVYVGDDCYEIKAQVPFMTRNRFGFSRNQEKKLKGAKYILLVSCCCSETSHWSAGRMWLIDVTKMPLDTWKHYETKSGAKMIGFQVGRSEIEKPDWMTGVYTLTETESKFLEDYNSSGWVSDKHFSGRDDYKHRVFE